MTQSRAIWSGAITFGMVVVPVKLYPATEGKDAVSFRQVHRADGGRIQFRRVCSLDGKEVPYADIAKGYELATGDVVVLGDDDLAELPLPTTKRIEVAHFCDWDEVSPSLYQKSYYLVPDPVAAHSYGLLASQLWESEKVAIAKVALRQRESLAMVYATYAGAGKPGMTMVLLAWPEEVRDVPEIPGCGEFPKAERDAAREMIKVMTAEFNPAEHSDGYRAAVESVVERRLSGSKDEVIAAGSAQQEQGADFLASLTGQVAAAKAAGLKPAGAKR